MLNTDAFIERLEELMENHQMNAASFAQKIGVQRSSVSHILSRRNKPSLEFIIKIQAEFEEADFDWLLLGHQKKTPPTPNLFSKEEKEVAKPQMENNPQPAVEKKSEGDAFSNPEITQIIETYKDGTFRVFFPKS
jgi:transcriptional regulator with XRE-family HTH domain